MNRRRRIVLAIACPLLIALGSALAAAVDSAIVAAQRPEPRRHVPVVCVVLSGSYTERQMQIPFVPEDE